MNIVKKQKLELTGKTSEVPPGSSVAQLQASWHISQVRQTDIQELKLLFQELHAFNSSLDNRFSLSENWESYFDNSIERAIEGGEALCLVAREYTGNRICGFILATLHRDSGMWKHREWIEVEDLYLEREWRGAGLAKLFLLEVEKWAETLEQPVVQLFVTSKNERAIRFYQRAGFRQTQAIMRKELQEC